MDIIINLLYSTRTSSFASSSPASDSLDKIKFLSSPTSPCRDGDDANLDIRIKVDKENGVLSIRDRGVGMTRRTQGKPGTIAKSVPPRSSSRCRRAAT